MSRRIPLSRGYSAIVDDVDYDRVIAAGPWHANPGKWTVYPQRNLRRPDGRMTTQYLHQFLMGWPGPKTDHRNGNGLDNRRENLRPANNVQNGANRQINRDNRSGFKGVSWHKRRNRWQAYICHGEKQRYLGLFDSAEDAARAYDAAAIETWGEFARVNFSVLVPAKGEGGS